MFTINIKEEYIPENKPDPTPIQESINPNNNTNLENPKNIGLSSKISA